MMDPILWLRLLTGITAGVLIEQGREQQAELLLDIEKAYRAGKRVDDLLQEAADRWAASGPPSVQELAETRAAIQARLD